jgi:hypothetical protein
VAAFARSIAVSIIPSQPSEAPFRAPAMGSVQRPHVSDVHSFEPGARLGDLEWKQVETYCQLTTIKNTIEGFRQEQLPH